MKVNAYKFDGKKKEMVVVKEYYHTVFKALQDYKVNDIKKWIVKNNVENYYVQDLDLYFESFKDFKQFHRDFK